MSLIWFGKNVICWLKWIWMSLVETCTLQGAGIPDFDATWARCLDFLVWRCSPFPSCTCWNFPDAESDLNLPLKSSCKSIQTFYDSMFKLILISYYLYSSPCWHFTQKNVIYLIIKKFNNSIRFLKVFSYQTRLRGILLFTILRSYCKMIVNIEQINLDY